MWFMVSHVHCVVGARNVFITRIHIRSDDNEWANDRVWGEKRPHIYTVWYRKLCCQVNIASSWMRVHMFSGVEYCWVLGALYKMNVLAACTHSNSYPKYMHLCMPNTIYRILACCSACMWQYFRKPKVSRISHCDAS